MTVLAFFIMTVSLAEEEDQFESLDDEHNEDTAAETVTAEHTEQSDYNNDQHAEEHQVMECRHYKIWQIKLKLKTCEKLWSKHSSIQAVEITR